MLPIAPAQPWPGFAGPNFTAVPDSFFDVLLPLLGDGEVRVLLYIMRRTFGFKKAADQISLAQIVSGIVRRDGTRLDSGAGLSKSSACRAIAALVGRGIIQADRRTTARHGHEATLYCVCMTADPLVPDVDKGVPEADKACPKSRQGLVPELDTQDTVGQETANKRIAPEPLVAEPAPSLVITAIVLDHARELRLPAKPSPMDRARTAWARSALGEEPFVARLYAAKQAALRGGAGERARRYWAVVEGR